MITVPKYDFRLLLPHLVSLGAVGAAIIGVFFGVGFLLLAPPHPVNPPADPIPPAQTPEAHEVAPSANNETAWGSSSAPVTGSRTIGATSHGEMALIPPSAITHAKRARVLRHHRQVTNRHWAGPLPGGGFYGPPNVNVGYINPR
jgi:hypothetical protein